eukprot:CAMPEP_0174965244 /NCGR_PEP_ID=MMETSP0004_2-20121128/6331_1 /TAXON_ID=420556 /ORGANISM="Ochromonas sp., Strain CCMP1393" /LENGTH=247 /DNA_ID=CAMNT_0016214065 /DNA_START=139 /DNA_END=882 /DNA_ORIENTATION=-
MVYRNMLSKKSLDETEVERDSSIRRKIKAIFNKFESDFASLDEYQNYEEMVEDIIYNLVNKIDISETNAKIERYKQENGKVIAVNQLRKNELFNKENASIKEMETAIADGNIKFQDELKHERTLKKQTKEQINQMMLGGDADPSLMARLLGGQSGVDAPATQTQQQQPSKPESITPANATTPGSAAPNPVMMFLCQREEPKPISKTQKTIKHNHDLRKMHQAGGYDFSSYEKRNWTEMEYGLDLSSR